MKFLYLEKFTEDLIVFKGDETVYQANTTVMVDKKGKLHEVIIRFAGRQIVRKEEVLPIGALSKLPFVSQVLKKRKIKLITASNCTSISVGKFVTLHYYFQNLSEN